ncbi:MAG: CRISPR-associated protein Cas4 [Candidatus Korarchaeota archaeon]
MAIPLHDIPKEPHLSANDFYQYAYCRRKFFLMKMNFPRIEKLKMIVSQQKHATLSHSDFPILPTHFSFYLNCQELNLSGIIDAVYIRDKYAIPMEYKFSNLQLTSAWKAQLCAIYLLLVASGYHSDHGYVVTPYNYMRVPLGEPEIEYALLLLKQMRNTLAKEFLPPPAEPSRCNYCETKKFCIK